MFVERRNQAIVLNNISTDYNGIWDLKKILNLASIAEIEQMKLKIREELQVIQVSAVSITSIDLKITNKFFSI